jgi:hypothetical protein
MIMSEKEGKADLMHAMKAYWRKEVSYMHRSSETV